MNFSSGVSNVTRGPTQRETITKNVILVALGISINYINILTVHTFNKHQIFKQNPRHILFIHLVINDMIQLTVSIAIAMMFQIVGPIDVPLCCVLMLLGVFTTQNTPLNVAVMALECYIAVCFPLRHSQICTLQRTHAAIGLLWSMSVLSVLPDLFILLATERLAFFQSRIYCYRDNVFRSSYSLAKRDASHIIFLTLVWITLFYSYFRIVFAAKTANTNSKKARNTILLHGFHVLLCMATYVRPMLLTVLTYFLPAGAPHFVSYVIIQVLPRSVSLFLYGLRDKTFRMHLKRYIACTERPNPHTMLKG